MVDKTLNTDDTLRTKVIENKIVDKNVLELADDKNIATYIFALSIGINRNKRLKSKKTRDYLRFSHIQNYEELSYLYSVALNDLKKENKDNLINDDDVVRKIVEEYVNAGLEVLDEMITDDYNEETMIYSLISEMDHMFNEIKSGR